MYLMEWASVVDPFVFRSCIVMLSVFLMDSSPTSFIRWKNRIASVKHVLNYLRKEGKIFRA